MIEAIRLSIAIIPLLVPLELVRLVTPFLDRACSRVLRLSRGRLEMHSFSTLCLRVNSIDPLYLLTGTRIATLELVLLLLLSTLLNRLNRLTVLVCPATRVLLIVGLRMSTRLWWARFSELKVLVPTSDLIICPP